VAAALSQRGWHFSAEQIQFRNTVRLDLRGDDALLLGRMKQKMRYNIHLAERKGVQIRVGSTADLPLLYQIYAETSLRDGFVIRDEAYYRAVWGDFIRAGLAEALVAEVDGEAVAALIVFRFAGTAWYLYGMSRLAHREKMPNALLQWEAIRRARGAGCLTYDLWGAPDEFVESDPLWGVFRFKEGLGGRVVRTLGAWDYPVNPWLYGLYTRTLPRLLDIMRRLGRRRTLHEARTD
jgi:lipid II:glycine glycyltransferase (peptidoglycan interpeptide bridge formation enzyme)